MTAETHRAAEMYESAIGEYRKALLDEQLLDREERLELRLRLADCLVAASRFDESLGSLHPLLLDIDALEPADRARVLARVGWAEFFLGNMEHCRSRCAEAVELLLPSSLHDELAQTLRWLGYSLRCLGDVSGAAERFRDALAAARRGRDASQTAFCLEALGNLRRLQGRYSEAIAYHAESRLINETRGSREHVATQDYHLALAHLYLGDWANAEAHFDTALKVFREICNEREEISLCISLCRLHRRRAEHGRARELAERAKQLAERVSYRRGLVLAFEELGDIASESGDPTAARRLYRQGLDLANEIAPDGYLGYELAWRLARTLNLLGQVSDAEGWAIKAIALAKKSSDAREHANSVATLALIRSRQNRQIEAIQMVEEALDEFRAIEAPFELAQTHELAYSIKSAVSGNELDAASHLLEARRLYTRLGASWACERIDQARKPRPAKRPRSEAEGRIASREEGSDTPELVAESEVMRALAKLAQELASIHLTVLIEGETGTGKEVLARIVHHAGPRAKKPFVALNCAAIPEALLDSELFGHRQGAFTGADKDRRGVLVYAEDGTAFLDEIDKASLDFQSKLLRVIDDRQVRPVGSSQCVAVKARIVCATNRDLLALTEKGAFLPDLYYRLAGLRLQIPPLRERPADIPVLVRHFLDQCVGAFDELDCPSYSAYEILPGVSAALAAYQWPGNVRELKNVVESCAFFAREMGVVRIEHLPPEIREGAPPENPLADTLPARIAAFERKHIIAAMKKADGVKTEAARILGVSRKGLNDRLHRLGLE